MRNVYLIVAVLAAVGAALGLWAYLTSTSGVDGTSGALIAFLGALAVALGALVALMDLPRWAQITLDVLLVLGAVLTAVAAWFLMQTFFTIVMALAAIVLCAGFVVAGRNSKHHGEAGA